MTKPRARVNVHAMVGTGSGSDRRAFIEAVGLAVLTVQCLPLMAHASGSAPGDGKEAEDNLIIHSGPGLLSHVHDLLIPYAVLKTPPVQGVELTSTKAFLHQHNIKLTQKDLASVNQGGTVTQKASSHVFVITLAKGQD